MAEDENIYYIQKQDDAQLSCVWQDAYTEVVAYEENVQDNSNLNITYVTEGNESSNENYETAGEDSQYYSVIETNNETLDHDQTLQPIEPQMNVNEDFKDNLTVIQYPTEEVSVKDELIHTKVENCDNTVVEDDDQVILYKIEDSNELFAVQIARDADGNVQKYQYKVRQNEDGQLEAVPGTIQIQPEGTEQLICEDTTTNKEEITINQNIVEDETQNFQSIYENSLSEGIKSENIVEEIINENEHITDEVKSEEPNYENANNEIEVEQEYTAEDEVVEKLDEENNHIEYLKQDEAEVLQHTGGGETYFLEEEEEFENVEYLQEDDDEEEVHYEQLDENYMEETTEHIISNLPTEEDQTFIKQYPPSSQVEVLSNVLMEANLTQEEPTPPPAVNTPKQILNKLSNITFGNESIELKRVNSGATSKQANKLTFLIVTHPETEKQNKNLINNKKFRSILRPTIHQHSSLQKNVYPPIYRANCKQIKQKTDVPITKITNTILNSTPSFNKGPRQPRKQVITPVDRVGSEIIIQAPEEKEIPVETYDLDAFSDEEYSPKVKPKKIYSTKKRGKKPTTKLIESIIISDNDKSTFEEDVENKIEIKKKEKPVEIKKPEKPKFDKVLPRKRGRPGRPKLSEKNKFNMIEKEVISSGSIKGGQSGRPKFIRTTRKISNGKQKENEEKSIRIEKELNEEVVNDESELITPKRRGRPPKKYSPDDNVTRKRKNSNEDVKNIDTSDKYFGFCSDSELDDKETIQEEPDNKKQKIDIENEKIDIENEKIDDLMSEMQDIHGVSADDEEEQPAKIDEILDEKPTETETLLSILETSPNEKEDVLTRALKSANIITPEEDPNKQEENTFLEEATDVKTKVIETKKISIEKKPMNSTGTTTYKCAKCSKTFLKYMSLKTHLQEHTVQNKRKGKFNCSKCSRVFIFENALKFHEKTHHNNQKLSENLNLNCTQCTKSFKTMLQLKSHQLQHKQYQCEKCSKNFQNRSELIQHLRNHTTLNENDEDINDKSTNLHCTHCTKSFKTMLQLKSHQLQHKRHKCEKCSENFQNRSELIQHLRNHTTKKENEDIKNDKTAKVRIFRRSTQDKREFSEILSKIDTTKRKTIAVTTSLSSDKTLKDDNKMPSIDVHRCNVCMKTFRQLVHLVMHREVHQKPTCSNCGQVFPFKHVLSEHMRRYCLKSPRITTNASKNSPIKKKSRSSLQNTDNTTYDCEKCKKTFKNKMFYQNHMKIHVKKSPNKQRKSMIMGKTLNTTNLSAATISERRKSDRKQVPTKKVMPIRCEICDLSFTTYTGLYRHTLSHPDIKEKCEYCDAGFETKAQLLKHLQTHVKSDVKLECITCKKTFKTNDELTKHECSEVKNDAVDKLNSEHIESSSSSSQGDKARNSDNNKNVLLTLRKSINIPKKKLAHGGIPLPLKLQNKLLKRKL